MKNFLIVTALLFSHIGFCQTAPVMNDLCLKYLVQLPTQKQSHTPVIIFLHGYGSDERDLFELRKSFPASYMSFSVRAPYPLSGGGNQWYEMTTTNGQRDGNQEQLKNSKSLIIKFIDEVTTKYNVDKKDIYLVGFSQGAIMCYQVGLTTPGSIRGIAPLSGRILPSLKPEIKNPTALQHLRIFIGHGTDDNRIPYQDGQSANEFLTSLHLKPEFHTYQGMGHSISDAEMKDLVKWLK